MARQVYLFGKLLRGKCEFAQKRVFFSSAMSELNQSMNKRYCSLTSSKITNLYVILRIS